MICYKTWIRNYIGLCQLRMLYWNKLEYNWMRITIDDYRKNIRFGFQLMFTCFVKGKFSLHLNFQDIHNDILSRQQPIFALCFQVEQLLDRHGDSLGREQKDLMQNRVPDTKGRLDAVCLAFVKF